MKGKSFLHKLDQFETNILRAAFCIEVFFEAFMCSQFGFVIFCRKEISAKAARKMFIKFESKVSE